MTTGCAITTPHRISANCPSIPRHSCFRPELLHSDSSCNTSHRGCLLRPLVVLALQRAVADRAGARTGQLVGNFGEGLREDVFPVGDLAIGQLGRAPVGCDGGRLGHCGWEAAYVGIVDCLAGTVGESVSLDTLGCGCQVAAYSRTAYSSALMIVGLGATSSDSVGDVAAAASRSLASVNAAAYTAEKRQSAVSFMLGTRSLVCGSADSVQSQVTGDDGWNKAAGRGV